MTKFTILMLKTLIILPVFRCDRQCRDVPPVAVLLPEWGRPLPAPAAVVLPRTQQKLLLPEGTSRGLRKGPSLGGNQVRFCYASEQNWQSALNHSYSNHRVQGTIKRTSLALALYSYIMLSHSQWTVYSRKYAAQSDIIFFFYSIHSLSLTKPFTIHDL